MVGHHRGLYGFFVTVHWAARGRRRFSEKYLLLRRILSPKTSSVPLCFRPVNAYDFSVSGQWYVIFEHSVNDTLGADAILEAC